MKQLFPKSLLFILALGLLVRLYHWQRPLADWHSWRQADTAAVTRRYIAEGIDLLHPKYDDLSSIPSGLDNPQGYRMVEFPLYNAFIAILYNLTSTYHHLPVHVFSRLIAIAFSLASVFTLYHLVKLQTSHSAALLSALIYALLPYWIFYSTTMLPEVPLVFFILASTLFWIRYCHHRQPLDLLVFTVLSATAFLLKPTFVFMALPFAYLYLYSFGLKGLTKLEIYLAAIAAITPLLLWRRWIIQYPEGIPSFDWLLNSTHIRFKGAFFNWLFAERYGKLILGYWGVAPFAIGLIKKPEPKSGWFFHFWLLTVLAYLTIFATGNVTHDYYQIITVPIVAIFTGLGFHHLLFERNLHFSYLISCLLSLITFSFMLAFSWFHLRAFFNINNPAIVAAGEYVDTHLPTDVRIIAPYLGDTAFLYQTNRQGWPIGSAIPQKIAQGATHYLTTTQDDEANDLLTRCQLLEKNAQFLLIDLSTCKF